MKPPIPNSESWKLDHVGIAVESLEPHRKIYTELFGFEALEEETLTEHQVQVQFFRLANSRLELIAPLPENKTLKRFLEKRGEGLHHVCFEVPSIREELKRLKDLRIQLIDQEPRPGFAGSEIAFIHPQSTGGMLIELCSHKNG